MKKMAWAALLGAAILGALAGFVESNARVSEIKTWWSPSGEFRPMFATQADCEAAIGKSCVERHRAAN
jgi:hypothetical protein